MKINELKVFENFDFIALFIFTIYCLYGLDKSDANYIVREMKYIKIYIIYIVVSLLLRIIFALGKKEEDKIDKNYFFNSVYFLILHLANIYILISFIK